MVLLFAAFQGGMTVIGWLVGPRVADWITTLDHWIALGLLTAVLSLVGVLGGVLVGVLGGRALGRAFGDRMQIVGGVVLFLIGTRILVTHLME
jgi:putative Mn2+ efflux pump MntP